MKIAVYFCLTITLAAAAFGEGTPPMITDDPGILGRGAWEINAGWSGSRRDGQRESQVPAIEFNYGIGEHVQLKYATALHVQEVSGVTRRRGLGNSVVGVKWRFSDEERHGLDASLHPQFDFRHTHSTVVREGALPDENFAVLPVQLQIALGETIVFAEIGRICPSKSDAEWFYGIVLCRNIGSRLTAGIELHASGANSFRAGTLVANMGAHIAISRRSALLVSVGRELRAPDGLRATLIHHVGWQWQL